VLVLVLLVQELILVRLIRSPMMMWLLAPALLLVLNSKLEVWVSIPTLRNLNLIPKFQKWMGLMGSLVEEMQEELPQVLGGQGLFLLPIVLDPGLYHCLH
jgi:hypothetical protein